MSCDCHVTSLPPRSSEERTKWISELTKAKAKDEGLLSTMGRNSPYAAVLNDPEAHSESISTMCFALLT